VLSGASIAERAAEGVGHAFGSFSLGLAGGSAWAAEFSVEDGKSDGEDADADHDEAMRWTPLSLTLDGISVAERKANHLTQAKVAAEMNVSQSVVAEIESSKADVRYSTLDRYAEAVTKHKKRLDLTPA
jgi:DNA-binding transcriptional regulator YiaG